MFTCVSTDNAIRLLDHLHRGGSYWYLWTVPQKQTAWFRVGDDLPITEEMSSLGGNLYFGVHPVTEIPTTDKDGNPARPEVVRGRIEIIAAINALFAEFDAAHFEGEKSKALDHIDALDPAPSIVVDSGGGYHCYWLFYEPFTIRSSEDRERARQLQHAWVDYVGGDGGAKDLARVLRVPGTLNRKYAPPRPVEFHKADFELLYSIDELAAYCKSKAQPTRRPVIPETRPAISGGTREQRRADAYTTRAFGDEVAAVRAAANGTRNRQLNESAFSLGQLVGGGLLSRSEVESALVNAAMSAGLSRHEAERTTRSGLDAGERSPRQLPASGEDEDDTAATTQAVYGIPCLEVQPDRVDGDVQGEEVKPPYPVAPKNIKTQHVLDALTWLGYEFRYNLMTDLVEVNGSPLEDTETARILVQMHDFGYTNGTFVEKVILARAAERKYHPLKDYLNGLKWDGRWRIDTLASYFQDDHDPVRNRNGRETSVIALYLRRWLAGAVAKVLDAEQNVMLVLAGPQGIGKSTFCKWLTSGVGGGYYVEEPISPDSKDAAFKLVEGFIWEAGELGATTKRQDVEALKAFITKSQITARRSYGKRNVTRQAVASFIGTVNGDGGGFLTDQTGSRRFLVVKLKSIDLAYTRLDINQIWAEAVHLYRSGEPWMLTGAEANVRNELNSEHQVVDPYTELISKWFVIDPASTGAYLSVTDIHHELIMRGALPATGNLRTTIADIGRALQSLGVQRKQRRIDGKPAWVYLGIQKRANGFLGAEHAPPSDTPTNGAQRDTGRAVMPAGSPPPPITGERPSESDERDKGIADSALTLASKGYTDSATRKARMIYDDRLREQTLRMIGERTALGGVVADD